MSGNRTLACAGRLCLLGLLCCLLGASLRAEQRVGIGAPPDNLARIRISPADLYGATQAGAGGRQNFVYPDNTRITVEAPETHHGQPFSHWRIQRPIGHPPEIIRSPRASVTLRDGNYLLIAYYGSGDSASSFGGAGGAWSGLGGLENFLPQGGLTPSPQQSSPRLPDRPSFGIPAARRRQLYEQAQRQFGPPVSARQADTGRPAKSGKPARTAKQDKKTTKSMTPGD
ncbi:MAG: hypothetical protein N2111_10350 [Candidatus Sumerlaeaceae bacterium]|nr:hypothetical protein [Candidatus Sumerlaeaceae bacterium]